MSLVLLGYIIWAVIGALATIDHSSIVLLNRDSPDESQTNVRVFPALLQDRREVLTATRTSGNPSAWSRV
jgi:hypothetical protein